MNFYVCFFFIPGIFYLTLQLSCKKEKTKNLHILKFDTIFFCHQNAVLTCRKAILLTQYWYCANSVRS